MESKYRLLLVEDGHLLAKSLMGLCEKQIKDDWETTLTRSIRETEELIDQGRSFDAALIDLGIGIIVGGIRRMGVMPMRGFISGEELAQFLQKSGTKVGFVSTMDVPESRQIASRLGVPFYTKHELSNIGEVVKQVLFWDQGVKQEQEDTQAGRERFG